MVRKFSTNDWIGIMSSFISISTLNHVKWWQEQWCIQVFQIGRACFSLCCEPAPFKCTTKEIPLKRDVPGRHKNTKNLPFGNVGEQYCSLAPLWLHGWARFCKIPEWPFRKPYICIVLLSYYTLSHPKNDSEWGHWAYRLQEASFMRQSRHSILKA